jgi:pSer/pThr/pTyr-binding forkhead associated (FHA) protein
MPVLTVYADKKKIGSYRIQADQPMTIGRLEQNAIVLDDPAVSSFHAEIESDGRRYFITDYQSRNGTFVNKELVISRQLAHGDRITINPYTLVFGFLHGEQADSGDSERMQATMHIDTSDHRSRLARSLSEMAGQESGGGKVGCLEFLKGGRQPFYMSASVTRLGKSPECDVLLKGWLVGRVAAEIQLSDNRYLLRYVGGMRKPRVNYRAVSHEVALNEFDILEIGPTAMQLQFRKPERPAQGGGTQEIELGPPADSGENSREEEEA